MLLLALVLGCVDDSGVGDPVDDSAVVTDDTAGSATGGGSGTLEEGPWRSEGADLSVLLAYLRVVRVDAAFDADGTYTVASTDSDGATATYAGTWEADTAANPHGIVLEQSSPSRATAAGLWDVTDGVLRYEIVQTEPVTPCSPPTAATGFGSTRCSPPLAPDANVQTFRHP
jgi:hypothetical protein